MSVFSSSTFLGGAGRFKVQSNTSWATVRGATSSDSNAATYEIESEFGSPTWFVQRVQLPIDTSSIPSGSTINSVTLNFNARYESGLSSTVAHLVKSTQSDTGTRDNADYNNVEFTSGGSADIDGATLQAESITGNATSLGWIVSGGITKIALIAAADLTNTDPDGGTDHFATITSPELVVDYTPPESSSVSPSLSPSASSSASASASGSASASKSASASASASPSLGYTGYTRGDEATLPNDDTDLETTYDAQDITDVATDNGVRVGQTGTAEYMIHQYKNFVPTGTCIIDWNGQSSLAPSSSTVFLQIYNRDTTAWETIDSNNAASAGTDFDLSASIGDLTNYKDSGNVISCRVYQEAV